jgi:hypothetical protein
MTASSPRRLPAGTTVVDVDGSRFLLEWLDWEVLAAAAAARLREPDQPPRTAAVQTVRPA